MNRDMKRNVVWITVGLVVASLVIAGGIFRRSGIFSGRGPLSSAGGVEIDEERSYSLSGVNRIESFSTSTDIRFKEGSGTNVRFHLHGSIRTTNKERVTTLVERSTGSRLEVGAEPPRGLIAQISSNLVLDIYLPANYEGGVAIDTVSGDVELPLGSFGELAIDTTSGDVDASAASNPITAESIKVETTSGDIRLVAIVAGEARLDSTSGDIDFGGEVETLWADTTSGDITLEIDGDHDDLSIESTSGDVRLYLPESDSFNLDAKSTSGDIETDFPITVTGTSGSRRRDNSLAGSVGGGGVDVLIKTVSGEISIQYLSSGGAF